MDFFQACLDFYFNCGLIGHGEKSYFNRSKGEGKDQGKQFREWLRCKSRKSPVSRNKEKINHRIHLVADCRDKERNGL